MMSLPLVFTSFGTCGASALFSGLSIVRTGSAILDTDAEVKGATVLIISLLPFLFIVGVNISFGDIYYMDGWSICLAILLTLMSTIAYTTLLTITYIIFLVIDTRLQEISMKSMLSLEDVDQVICLYTKCKAGLDYPILIIFVLTQGVMIVSIFLMVAHTNADHTRTEHRSTENFGACISCFIASILAMLIVLKAEQLYDQLADISFNKRQGETLRFTDLNSRKSSAAITQIIVMKLNFLHKLKELEAIGPLSGAGFFSIDKSTLTAIFSTTATYAIILMQWKPASSKPPLMF